MTTTAHEILECNDETPMDVYAATFGLGHAYNFIQTVREHASVRIDLKRVACLVDMHCRHHIDVRVGSGADRVYFEALGTHIDAFLWGSIFHESLLTRARRILHKVRRADRSTTLARRITSSPALCAFDTAFMTQLVRRATSHHEKDEEDDQQHNGNEDLALG